MSATLGYFTLDTPDVGKARAFYGALFGWTFDEEASHETYAHVSRTGEVEFGFVKGEHTDYSHLYFRVEDVDATCVRITELGGKCAVPADSSSGRSVAACDDQGVSFGLWQPARQKASA